MTNKHQLCIRSKRTGDEYTFKPGDNLPLAGSFGVPKPRFVRINDDGTLIICQSSEDGPEYARTADAFVGVYIKCHVNTIDLTPTWRAIMPVLLEALTNGTETGKRLAREELYRLADSMDEANRETKKG